jgi:hypothetical protein
VFLNKRPAGLIHYEIHIALSQQHEVEICSWFKPLPAPTGKTVDFLLQNFGIGIENRSWGFRNFCVGVVLFWKSFPKFQNFFRGSKLELFLSALDTYRNCLLSIPCWLTENLLKNLVHIFGNRSQKNIKSFMILLFVVSMPHRVYGT